VSQAILDGVQLKLVRAQQHVDELRDTVRKAQGGSQHEIVDAYDPKTPNEIILKARVNKSPDPYWGAILGDAIQNCRSVLDHIYTALVDAAGRNSSRAYFPIYKTPGEFQKSAVPLFKQHRIPPIQRTLIETLQPYHGTTRPATDHPAWVLRELANIDKHRALVTQTVIGTSVDVAVTVGGKQIQIPPYKKPLVIDDGTELIRLEFFHRGTQEVNVKGRLQTRLYAEGRWPLVLASEGVLTWVRDDVVARFAPVLRNL
jgi:hypothetical protein